MVLPTPNLDDRSWDDIVEEAMRLIPQYCPDWTNFNPSDPGVTLIELFAWMTEMILYRLNKVPDKVYLTLLELIGVRLQPPQPAEAMLTFSVAEGTEGGQWVPARTQVATEGLDGEEPVIFETDDDLYVLSVKLLSCFTINQDKVFEASDLLANPSDSQTFEAFSGATVIDRILYLGDDRFSALVEPATIQLTLRCPEARDDDFLQLVEWEYWNGRRWRELEPTAAPTDEELTLGEDEEEIEGRQKVAQSMRWVEEARGRSEGYDAPKNAVDLYDRALSAQCRAIRNLLAIEKEVAEAVGAEVEPPTVGDRTMEAHTEELYSNRDFAAAYEYYKQLVRHYREEVDATGEENPYGSRNLEPILEGFREARYQFEMASEKAYSVAKRGINTISFQGPIEDIAPLDLTGEGEEEEGEEQFWIRARLIEVPIRPEETLIEDITARLMIFQEGVVPDACCANIGPSSYLPLDLSTSFFPFGERPEFDYAFYVQSEECFGRSDAQIRLDVNLVNNTTADRPNPTDDLRIKLEYWNGRQWTEWMTMGNNGVIRPKREYFEDTTNGFSQDGYIGFVRPDDLETVEVNGEEGYWIRFRIDRGDYGSEGKYVVEEDQWVWKNEHPLRPPRVKSLQLKYYQIPHSVQRCVTYNDFNYKDYSDWLREAATGSIRRKSFQPFEPFKEENPALYVGFSDAFPHEKGLKPIDLYIRVVEDDEGVEDALEVPFAEEMASRRRRREKEDQRVAWEYWNGRVWTDLRPSDGTENLTRSGVVRFTGPADFKPKREFGEELHWIRARLEMGSYARSPEIVDIRLNTVLAKNAVTRTDELLGSSDGTPDQKVQFNYRPVLEGQSVLVRENEMPSRRQARIIRQEEGEDAIQVQKDSAGNVQEIWVRWHEVESFYNSGPHSRHYVLDAITGTIRFGDGIRGMIPPMGPDNIKAESYQTGGGQHGNVGRNAITLLRHSIAYIEEVKNPYPARNGSDQETIQEAKLRGPQLIRNRYRAVTAEDYEWLTKKASGNVARAKCLPSPDKAGEVKVLIVPKEETVRSDLTRKPVPTPELLRRVKDFLEERRVLTTRLQVVRPKYVEISVHLDVVLKPLGPRTESLKRSIEEQIRTYLHPSRGGQEGEGWPFGRHILKSDLYQVVEQIEGIDYIEELKLYDEDRRFSSDKINLEPDELVHVVDVVITELVKETIG